MSPEELVSLYRRASALVFPSLYEGFGQPPLEAMACGCPVACSDAASLPEVCGDAARYFDPKDTDQIADAVLDVLADPEPWRERGLERARSSRGSARRAPTRTSTASFSDRGARRARRASRRARRPRRRVDPDAERLREVGADDDPAPQRPKAGRQRPDALDDRDRVPRRVVHVRRRGGAAGRSRALVTHDCVRDEDDGEARGARAQRQVDVLDVGEEPLVEQPRRAPRPPARSPSPRRRRGRRRAARGSGRAHRSPCAAPSSRARR